MVLHQNRADRGRKTYLPEEILPEFLDLIIWGHEHDCRIIPEQNYKHQFHVSQPGSSTPTSLSEGESIKKHCGILQVYKDKFKMIPIPLETVRPFVYKSINLEKYAEEYAFDEGDSEVKVMDFAKEHIEKMIAEAQEKITNHPKQPTLPLIRLRLEYKKEEYMFNAIRFGQAYNKIVANPSDIISFKKEVKRSDTKSGNIVLDGNALNNIMKSNTRDRVEDVVEEYFELPGNSKKLQVFPIKALNEITNRIVNREDMHAADKILE